MPSIINPYNVVEYSAGVGSGIPLTSKHKGIVAADYTLLLDAALGAISVAATYTYTDCICGASVRGVLPDYSLLNLNVEWKAMGGMLCEHQRIYNERDEEEVQHVRT